MRINEKVVIDIFSGRILERVARKYQGPMERCLPVDKSDSLGFLSVGAIQANAGNILTVSTTPVLQGEQWLVEACSLIGVDPNGVGSFANPISSGIFLCPSGTNRNPQIPVGPAGVNFSKNFLSLPTDGAGAMWGSAQGGQTLIATHVTKEFTVPALSFIMGIWDAGAGALPANGSSLILSVSYARRQIC